MPTAKSVLKQEQKIHRASAHFFFARELQKQSQWNAALREYSAAIIIYPAAEAYRHRFAVLMALKQFADAVSDIRKVIEMCPGEATLHFDCGIALNELSRWREASAEFGRAISLKPKMATAHFNMGVMLERLGSHHAACVSYDRSLQLDPDNSVFRSNRMHARFKAGDLQGGHADHAHFRPQPWRWSGEEPVSGKLFFAAYGGDGLGDSIQFCRYARNLAELGAKVILQVQPALVGLLGGVDGAKWVIPTNIFPSHFDHASSLFSLHGNFGLVPTRGAYIKADSIRVDAIRARLLGRKPLIGLVWWRDRDDLDRQGPLSLLDSSRLLARRSAPLTTLLQNLPAEFQYVSLQREHSDTDKEAFAFLDVLDRPATLDLDDTAALMECCDLVITIDTSLAHLAGALARPTWILLPFFAEWRWGETGNRTEWYSTARLYRQDKILDWTGVLGRLGDDLRGYFQENAGDISSKRSADDLMSCEPSVASALQPDCRAEEDNQPISFGPFEKSIACFDIDIRMHRIKGAYFSKAAVFMKHKLYDAALQTIDEGLVHHACDAMLHSNRGAILNNLRRYDEAIVSADRAIALDPALAGGWVTRGRGLILLKRFDEAIHCFQSILEFDPGNFIACVNLSNALLRQGRYRESVSCLDGLIARQPATGLLARAHLYRAGRRLTIGDRGGYEDFDWRLQVYEPARMTRPRWRGESLTGKTLLIHPDPNIDDLGDTFQFSRFAECCSEAGATVFVAVQRELERLLSRLKGVERVLCIDDAQPSTDLHCSFLDLPGRFNTDLTAIVTGVTEVQVNAAKVAKWRAALPATNNPRVGLIWRTKPKNGGDSPDGDVSNAMEIGELVRYLPPGFSFVSLQREVLGCEAEVLAQSGILHFRQEMDLDETAAVMQSCDLIVTIDTGPAHLAASLGRPTWIVLPFNADWRWGLGSVTGWYPAATLYRQNKFDDWSAVLEQVRRDLVQRFPHAEINAAPLGPRDASRPMPSDST